MPTVIIIDDEEDHVEVLSKMLKFYGVDVLAIGNNGLDAVKLFQKHKPDFTILDYNMPDYNGLYALQEIRKISPNSKIIILTAYLDSKIMSKLLENGVHSVMEKPFKIKSYVQYYQISLLDLYNPY